MNKNSSLFTQAWQYYETDLIESIHNLTAVEEANIAKMKSEKNRKFQSHLRSGDWQSALALFMDFENLGPVAFFLTAYRCNMLDSHQTAKLLIMLASSDYHFEMLKLNSEDFELQRMLLEVSYEYLNLDAIRKVEEHLMKAPAALF